MKVSKKVDARTSGGNTLAQLVLVVSAANIKHRKSSHVTRIRQLFIVHVSRTQQLTI
jgi:hypothetical protein